MGNARVVPGSKETLRIPSVSLPKGGGAVRGIGEKFAANPVTGTGSTSVPVWTTPGRGGFGPSLSLSYDSGSGNGLFGLGWTLSMPAITRRTDKGLPTYDDASGSDVFVLSGAEDLVPLLEPDGTHRLDDQTAPGFVIERFRPRLEGSFARIERWTSTANEVHWRSLSRDNVLTLYGAHATSRVVDPEDGSRVFSWLVSETRDPRGNAIVYDYKAEDGEGVDLARPCERNRGPRDDVRRRVVRHLKRIRYGNRRPLLLEDGSRPRFLADLPASVVDGVAWMFEVVLDYGDHDESHPEPEESGPWATRADPSSTYRSGFECRTLRRCRRILMFHHVPDVPGGAQGYDGLVRATELTYTDELDEPGGAVPAYSLLQSVTQAGYRRTGPQSYAVARMPSVDFTYSLPVVQDRVETVDPQQLAHLPVGVDGGAYQWTDLHGDGIPGVVTEQAGAWFYTRNLSPLGTDVRFCPTETVNLTPSATLTKDRARFVDLTGDGQPDLVVLGGPTPGFFEHDDADGWLPFRAFASAPDRDLRDLDVMFVDLDGDGHADLLLADEDAWVWHPSLAESGFAAQRRVAAVLEEEHGPRVVVAGTTEALMLADLSGDGLSDLVRVRNGEVCYWPNLGHGRFGAKVAMDDAPRFDQVDQFDPDRLRLADIDGSGTTDLVYLHRDGVRLWFNMSGNAWSGVHPMTVSPAVDERASIDVTDLLGNGTACLVWSARSTPDGRPSMRYVNLMGAEKPHLLVGMDNNLGLVTRFTYAPSTRFMLADREAGRPWSTRLPFPVHVVERVETHDLVGRNVFVSRYAYHDGFFDGDEREFRGFAMVEQWDTDQLGTLEEDGVGPSVRLPAVHIRSWFDTGAPQDHASSWEWFTEPGVTQEQATALRLGSALPPELSPDDVPEARRALKGLLLRQEVYTDDGSAREAFPFVVSEHSYTVEQLQRRGAKQHAVHLTHPRESLTSHYERDPSDPRVQHTLTLETDAYGTVTQQADIAYGRRVTTREVDDQGHVHDVPNPGLAPLDAADQDVQTRLLATCTTTTMTAAIDDVTRFPDDLRTPLPCQTTVHQLTGHPATGPGGRYAVSDLVVQDADGVRPLDAAVLPFEASPAGGPTRRLVERTVTVFRADDLASLLPLASMEPRCLPGETYRLAFTPGLLDTAFRRPGAPEVLLAHDDPAIGGLGPDGGGYVRGADLKADGRLPATDSDDEWWIPSGRTSYAEHAGASPAVERAEARAHFFVARRYRDPFGHETLVSYDDHELMVVATTDPLGNSVATEVADYRVLQPQQVRDVNGNRAAAAFDALGLVAGTAVMGKAAPAAVEGDSLEDFAADLDRGQVDALHDAADPRPVAVDLLGPASTRMVYDLHRFRRSRLAAPDAPQAWLPTYTATVSRESHLSEAVAAGGLRVQVAFAYSDGLGRVVQKKIQAEPGPVLEGGPVVTPRWVGSGWTLFNEKGSPVRSFEPFFSRVTPGHHFEFAVTAGVSPVLVYDPLQRVVAGLNPNHSYTKVRFGPWQRTTYDVNDTCAARGAQTGDPRTDADVGHLLAPFIADLDTDPAEPWQTWHDRRAGGALGAAEKAAADQSAAHADTPTTVHLDALGRPFLTVLHNRVVDAGHPQDGLDQRVDHRVALDIEGNRVEVRDGVTAAEDAQGAVVENPVGRLVARVVYDLLGRPLRDASMEAGTRWVLPDVAGKPVRKWDSRGHRVRTSYDPLRRPTHTHVAGLDSADPGRELLTERLVYGEQHPDADDLNLRGTVFLHLDQSGALTNGGHDFKANPVGATRRLTSGTAYRETVDWVDLETAVPADPAAPLDLGVLGTALATRLEVDGFTSHSSYDALNRPRELVTPHRPGASPTVVRHSYNEANLLEAIDVNLHGEVAAGAPVWTPFVTNVDYDAKGQRQRIERGNGVTTELEYDPDTFQLVRLRSTRPKVDFADDCPQPAVVGWPGCGVQDHRITYDPAGNIVHLRDAAQQRIFFANRRVEPDTSYAYDASYQLVRANGREHLGQGDSAASAFDAGRVGVLLADGDGTAMGTYTERFSYDRAGNLTETAHASDSPGRSWTRTHELAEASQLDDETGVRAHSNRLSGAAVAAQAETLSYDEHGNVVRMGHLGDGGPGPNLHWNHLDQLVQVDHGGGGTTYYAYDAGGQRVRTVREKTASLTEERIALGDADLFRRRRGADLMERETLHVRDGRSLVALVETRTVDTAGDDAAPPQVVRYQLGDHLASSRVEVDQRGRVISYEEYAAFGGTSYQGVRSTTDAPKRFRFTGHERDEGTGLYAMGARYYASWLGRWISCDPAGIADSPNRYEYVANNPIRHVDTTGRGLWDRTKAFVSDGADRAVAAVKPGGTVFEAVDNAFKPDAHPVSAAVLNNMAKRGEGIVSGATGLVTQTGEDYGDIAYGATHLSEPGAKKKLTAAIDRRMRAPEEMAVGMAKGFAGQLKSVGEGLGTVAYYRPELLGLAGLPSHAKEQGADAKVASAITDIVLDGPQIVLTVDGGINLAKSAGGALAKPPGLPAARAGTPSLNSSNALAGVEPATPELLEAIGKKRTMQIAQPGSEEIRYLDHIGAEANVGGPDMDDILLRPNPSKAAALEEFLHGTQQRVGLIDRLGMAGAETHVKDFMIRHQKMLGLGVEDVSRLQKLKDMGL